MPRTVTSRGSGNSNTASSTFTFSPASNFTPGSFAVLLIGNYEFEVGFVGCSVSDTDGNTWTVRTEVGDGRGIHIATCDSVSLTTADTITITWGGDDVQGKGYFLYEVTGGGAVEYKSANSTTFASNGTITSGTIESGNVIFGFNVRNSTIAPTTPDTDTTNGSWSTQVGISTGTTTYISSQYKIVTADGAQTYNIVTGVSGAIGYLEVG